MTKLNIEELERLYAEAGFDSDGAPGWGDGVPDWDAAESFDDAMHNAFPALVAHISALEKRVEESEKYRLSLESLTPLGSEYYKDPERCVTYVRDYRDTQHKAIVKFKLERDELQRENDALRQELTYWKNAYRNSIPDTQNKNTHMAEMERKGLERGKK